MWIFSFLLGIIVGSGATLYVIYKSLTSADPNQNRKELGGIDLESEKDIKKPNGANVFDAFKKKSDTSLVGTKLSEGEDSVAGPSTIPPNYANMSPVELEKVYSSELKVFRENQKQMKSFHSFFMELSKSYSAHAKDLVKHSLAAHNNLTKLVSGAQPGEAETLAVYMESLSEDDTGSSTSYVDVWWKSLSIALDHLSHDTDVLAIKLTAEIGFEIQRLSEEYVLIEKKLFEDGSRYLAQLKECNAAYDLKIKDKCRHQERLEKLMLLPNQGGSEAARIQAKINACDTALQESATSLNIITSHFVSAMPRIISSIGLYNLKSKSILSTKIMSFVDACVRYDGKMAQVFQRLREDCMVVTRATSTRDVNMLLTGQVDASTSLQLAEIKKMFKEASATDARLAAEAEAPTVNMASVAMAALAASSPEDVKLQMQSPVEMLMPVIGTETCVWLNAFTGRIYRDISKSDEFHEWLCALVGRLLNKAPKRPDYIEEFKIESVEFGGLPPIIRNVKWIPGEAAAGRARGDTMGSQDGEDGLAADAPSIPGTEKNMPAYNLNSFPYDEEFDVNCEGDMTFRSGVTFSVSTKIWINWPKEKYASIPVLLKLNMEEVAGPIRFGVIKNSCCFSFLEMPYTRFRVVSELGDQFKIKNVPKLSDMIIKQIRKVMFNRMVYPHAHTFKLVWPRHWWPQGTRNDWPHQGPVFTPEPVAAADIATGTGTAADQQVGGDGNTVDAASAGSQHTSNLSILSKKSAAKPVTASASVTAAACAPIMPDSCTSGGTSGTGNDGKSAEKKSGFRSAISSFFQSTKTTETMPPAATVVRSIPVKTAATVTVKGTAVTATAVGTVPAVAGTLVREASAASKSSSSSSSQPSAPLSSLTSSSTMTVSSAVSTAANAPATTPVDPPSSSNSSPDKVVNVLESIVQSDKPSPVATSEETELAGPIQLDNTTSLSKPSVDTSNSISSDPGVGRRLSQGKQGSLDDIGLQTTDTEEREKDKRKQSPKYKNVANDDSTNAEDVKTTPIRRRLSHIMKDQGLADSGTTTATLGTDVLTQKPIVLAPPDSFVSVQVEEFPKQAGSSSAAASSANNAVGASSQVDQSFELTPDKGSVLSSPPSAVQSAAGASAASDIISDPAAKKRTSSFSGLAALLHGSPAQSTVPPLVPVPVPVPPTSVEPFTDSSAREDGSVVAHSKSVSDGSDTSTNASFYASVDEDSKGEEEEGTHAGGSRWRSMLQAGKDRILHGKGSTGAVSGAVSATPAPGTGNKGSSPKDKTTVAAAQLVAPIKKPDEIMSSYVCIPSPGVVYSEERATALKKYFVVLRKQKLLIYNNADEYNKSNGSTGTRASYTLLGSMCRPTSETESGFEIWFSATSSYNKGKRSGDPDKWLAFWTSSPAESKQWILAIMAQSEPS